MPLSSQQDRLETFPHTLMKQKCINVYNIISAHVHLKFTNLIRIRILKMLAKEKHATGTLPSGLVDDIKVAGLGLISSIFFISKCHKTDQIKSFKDFLLPNDRLTQLFQFFKRLTE